MYNIGHYAILLGFLFVMEILYFKIAAHYNIIDKPNHRSSHTSITIRGGGIIFSLAILGWFFTNNFSYPYFVAGLFSIALISFLDDMLTLNNKVRLSVHLFAVFLLFLQWDLFALSWYWLIMAAIFVIATINAYNFMDGINGITGSYSLLTIGTLYYINEEITPFTSPDLLIVVGLSLMVFNFFNFRKKAKCFAGDVGSVSIAFVLIFIIGQLILETSNLSYILLLLIYGMDTAFTVFFRRLRRENIFEAHRSHFYQYLVNHLKYSHLFVSFLYFMAQFLINMILILLIKQSTVYAMYLFIGVVLLYLLLRFKMEGKTKLLIRYES
jgi:UDP-GlcNAc:undecaprenyl-phosphate/decaprenyl-phosphate GlcNAc-1-phosphate transferase